MSMMTFLIYATDKLPIEESIKFVASLTREFATSGGEDAAERSRTLNLVSDSSSLSDEREAGELKYVFAASSDDDVRGCVSVGI